MRAERRSAVGAQIVEDGPGGLTEQADDDLAVGQRGVVVWISRRRDSASRSSRGGAGRQICDGVHVPWILRM